MMVRKLHTMILIAMLECCSVYIIQEKNEEIKLVQEHLNMGNTVYVHVYSCYAMDPHTFPLMFSGN